MGFGKNRSRPSGGAGSGAEESARTDAHEPDPGSESSASASTPPSPRVYRLEETATPIESRPKRRSHRTRSSGSRQRRRADSPQRRSEPAAQGTASSSSITPATIGAGLALAAVSAAAVMVLVGSILGAANPPAVEGNDNAAAKELKKALRSSTGKNTSSEVELDRGESLVAVVSDPKQKIDVYSKRSSNEPEREFNRRDGQDGPLVFGVTKQREHRLKVMLPKRPNGSTAWVLRRDVDLSTTSWKVKVDLSDHTVAVKRGGKTRDEWSIGLGQPQYPTPTGEFYTTELIKPKEEGTIYGAYVFVLSGYSEKLTDFAGGNGELGLHGTNDNSGLGSDVSNGCIRMRNAAITKLANRMPLGTPVNIVK